MKRILRIFLAALLAAGAAAAHAQRSFEPAELEALLAPVALYPDPLLQQILEASQHPQDLAAAARWSRANPQLSGDAALATVQGTGWAPSVKALAAHPEILLRMDESPQWRHDLGEAYAADGARLMDTVPTLRARAQASGYLQSNDQQYVYDQGGAIYVQPVYPNAVYVPYYNPYVVYGGWGWSSHRPPHWRPWAPHRHVAPRIVVQPYHRIPESRRQPFVHGGGSFIHSVPQAAPRPFVRERRAASGPSPFARRAPEPRGHGANPFARR